MSLYKITSEKLYYLRYSKNTIESYLFYVNKLPTYAKAIGWVLDTNK